MLMTTAISTSWSWGACRYSGRGRRRFDGCGRIAGADAVDEGGEPVGKLGVRDLEDVLRVLLARVREVEAAEEDDVVSDRDLRVHVVVHRALGPWRRPLAREQSGLEDALEQRDLP